MAKVFTITEGLENMGALKTGGQGSVYKARRTDGTISAVKLLPTPLLSESEDDKNYRDFKNEVDKLQRVNEEHNPNIVRILSAGVTDTGSFPYIEMEFIEGPDLCELLQPPHPPVFPLKEALRIADHLSSALAHCHSQGVKHGDIKSNNIKLDTRSGNYVLLDFGLAAMSDEQRRTSLRHAGAIEFMAPEQNEGQMLFQTDVYSFGVVLYELLTGQVPFPLNGQGETARNAVMVAHMEEPVPDLLSLRRAHLPANWGEEQKLRELLVPSWLLHTLERCLQKRPEDRFPSAVELHTHITQQLAAPVEETEEQLLLLARQNEELARRNEELQQQLSTLHDSPAEEALYSHETTDTEAPRRRSGLSTPLLLVLLLVVAGGIAGYTLLKSNTTEAPTGTSVLPYADSTNATTDDEPTEYYSATPPLEEAPAEMIDTLYAQPEPGADTLANTPFTTPEEPAQETQEDTTTRQAPPKEKEKRDTSTTTGGLNSYKVIGKAFFHNQPDENTRRNAFITHWNNAVLHPTREQNGFVYVVFTNHLGQTSKGWIRKSDLVEVKE